LLDGISGGIAQLTHLIGLCLVVYALILIVRSLDRGDLFSGLIKAIVYGLIGMALLKL
jgi:hypothetical protein